MWYSVTVWDGTEQLVNFYQVVRIHRSPTNLEHSELVLSQKDDRGAAKMLTVKHTLAELADMLIGVAP